MENWSIKYIIGDLVQSADNYDVIAHGCNNFCTMGRGIALAIKRRFPKAYEVDKKTRYGDIKKLGTISVAECDNVTIVNAYIQHHYTGRDVLVEYHAVRECLREIKKRYSGKKIGLPKIGAGLAGGDFMAIENIIKDELKGEDVTVVILNESEWPCWISKS